MPSASAMKSPREVPIWQEIARKAARTSDMMLNLTCHAEIPVKGAEEHQEQVKEVPKQTPFTCWRRANALKAE